MEGKPDSGAAPPRLLEGAERPCDSKKQAQAGHFSRPWDDRAEARPKENLLRKNTLSLGERFWRTDKWET